MIDTHFCSKLYFLASNPCPTNYCAKHRVPSSLFFKAFVYCAEANELGGSWIPLGVVGKLTGIFKDAL